MWGKRLQEKGLIERPVIFWAQEKLSDYRGKIKPGTYLLNTHETVDEMLAILSGKNTEGQPSAGRRKQYFRCGGSGGRGGECLMIVDERMVTFINSLDEGHTEFLGTAGKRSKGRCGSYCKKGNAELFKVSDGSCQTETDSGGGNCSWVFCSFDV